MAFKLPENVYQTSNGGGPGLLNLVAAPSGRQNFADWLNDGDTTIATIKDTLHTETSRVTFNTGPDRITRNTLIRSDTGGIVNFVGGGVLDITIGMPGLWMEKLTDPASTLGMLARLDDDGNIIARTLGDGTWVAWTNGNGVSGAPVLDDAGIGTNFVSKTGGSTQIISPAVQFDNVTKVRGPKIIYDELAIGTPKEFVVQADDAGIDRVFRFQQLAIDSYNAHVRIAAAWQRILTVSDEGAGNGLDADTVDGIEADAIFSGLSSGGGKYFELPATTLVSAGSGSSAHSISGFPRLMDCTLKCNATDAGWAVNDEIHNVMSDGARGLTFGTDATNVFWSNASSFKLNPKTGGNAVNSVITKWDIILKAWK